MRNMTQILSIKNITIGFILFWLGLFVLVPGILVLLVSFFTNEPGNFYSPVLSIESYLQLTDSLYLKVLWNSLILAFWTTLVTMIIGYAYAFAVVNCHKKWHPILLIAILLPFWTNSLVRIYGIKNILGNRGFINNTLQALGLTDEPINLLFNNFAVVVGMVSILLPYMILPIYSSLQKIDNRLIEAAKDLGASSWAAFARITFPLSFPGLLAGFTLVFLPSMGMFYISEMLGGPKSLLIGSVIKSEFLLTRNWPLGAALSIGMIVVLMASIWLANRLQIGNVEARETK